MCRRAAMILSTARAPRPGTRSSISRSARVDVDRKAVAVLQRPGELRVDVEIEHAVLAAGRDLVDGEAVMAQQPVGLIKPVLALQAAAPAAAGCALASGIGLNAE